MDNGKNKLLVLKSKEKRSSAGTKIKKKLQDSVIEF